MRLALPLIVLVVLIGYYRIHDTCRDAKVYIQYEVKLFWDYDKNITEKFPGSGLFGLFYY